MRSVNWRAYSVAREDEALFAIEAIVVDLATETDWLEVNLRNGAVLVNVSKAGPVWWVRLRGQADGALAIWSHVFGYGKCRKNSHYGLSAYGSLSAGVASKRSVRRFRALLRKAEKQLRRLQRIVEKIGKRAMVSLDD
jgi:hypothetical protein